jgi:hypothetical protein
VIPYSWVSYCRDNQPKGRWDQAHLQRLLEGDEWQVPGVAFEETPWVPGETTGKILIVPAGHYRYHENCTRQVTVKFRWALKQMEWALVILTSDEAGTFPVDALSGMPRVRFWVQLPVPGRVYPPHTRFLGEGSPRSALHMAVERDFDTDKTIDVFFAGQDTHPRRHELVEAMKTVKGAVCLPTGGFKQGLPLDEYYRQLSSAKVAPAPSGKVSQSSFRLYEALEAGAIPIADAVRADGRVNGYWDLVHPNSPLHTIGSWANLPDHAEALLEPDRPGGWERNVSIVSSWWTRCR